MPITDSLTDCFSPEERRRGEALLDAVMLSSHSDTGVRARVKNFAVNLTADSIESSSFTSSCTCPSGRLCKHVWAVLLKLDEKDADFLQSKTAADAEPEPEPTARETAFKERQTAFRKVAKEKQKTRARERKAERNGDSKPSKTAFAYPSDVENARAYFIENGCELSHPLDMAALINARKTLARVFHPDRGGTHDEALVLNENFTIIRDYLES